MVPQTDLKTGGSNMTCEHRGFMALLKVKMVTQKPVDQNHLHPREAGPQESAFSEVLDPHSAVAILLQQVVQGPPQHLQLPGNH